MGNGEWGMGNGEWGMGNGEWGKDDIPTPHSPLPTPAIDTPHSPLPTPHSPFPTPSIDNPSTRFYSSLAKVTSAGGLKTALFSKPSTPTGGYNGQSQFKSLHYDGGAD